MNSIVINESGIHAQDSEGNLVRFEDNTKMIMLKDRESFQKMFTIENNTINGEYKIPSGYEIVIQWQGRRKKFGEPWFGCDSPDYHYLKNRPHFWETRQVAILKKVEKEENIRYGYIEGSEVPANDEPRGEVNFIEEILHGLASCQNAKRTEREVIYGLRDALIFAGKLPHGSALTGQLCDVADLLWEWHQKLKASSQDSQNNPQS